MKSFFAAAALASLVALSCAEQFNPYDVDAHSSSTALPAPPPGRIWLRRKGETRLWWADDLRRERLIYNASMWDVVDRAEAAGVKFIEVTPDEVLGRNERGEVVITLLKGPDEPLGCELPNH